MTTSQRNIHVIGAGMAGLAAALQLGLSGEKVTLYEAAPFAGGRCRSFHDRDLGCIIDNGNHLVLSGNVAVQDFLYLIDATDSMGGAGVPEFPFIDLANNERWTVRMGMGRIPFWMFDKKRRVAGTKLSDYTSALPVMAAGDTDRVGELLDENNILFKRFWEPLVIGALNTETSIASAKLLSAIFGQTFMRGGKACIPLIPKIGLSESFVQPCLDKLQSLGVNIKFNQRLRTMKFDDTHVRELDFNGTIVSVAPNDWVVMALPAWIAKQFLPEIQMPVEFRSIISAHFKADVPAQPLSILGVVGGISEWIFVKHGVVSVTISCAERYEDTSPRDMVRPIWEEIAKIYNLNPTTVPPHKIFKERCATFAATPEQNRRRPMPLTSWDNLALAGEWTATGLPSTIEGALRSGFKAAQVVQRWD